MDVDLHARATQLLLQRRAELVCSFFALGATAARRWLRSRWSYSMVGMQPSAAACVLSCVLQATAGALQNLPEVPAVNGTAYQPPRFRIPVPQGSQPKRGARGLCFAGPLQHSQCACIGGRRACRDLLEPAAPLLPEAWLPLLALRR